MLLPNFDGDKCFGCFGFFSGFFLCGGVVVWVCFGVWLFFFVCVCVCVLWIFLLLGLVFFFFFFFPGKPSQN